jgi:hypothetical protein
MYVIPRGTTDRRKHVSGVVIALIVTGVMVIAALAATWWLWLPRHRITRRRQTVSELMEQAARGAGDARELICQAFGDYPADRKTADLLKDDLKALSLFDQAWAMFVEVRDGKKYDELKTQVSAWLDELESIERDGGQKDLLHAIQIECDLRQRLMYVSDGLRDRLTAGRSYVYAGASDRIVALRQQWFDYLLAEFRCPPTRDPHVIDDLYHTIAAVIRNSGSLSLYPRLDYPPDWNQLIASNFVCPPLEYFDDDARRMTISQERQLIGLALELLDAGNVGETNIRFIKLAAAQLAKSEQLLPLFPPDTFLRLQRASFHASPLAGTALEALMAEVRPKMLNSDHPG